MIDLILFILIVFGISTIISQEYLFSFVVDKFKKYDKLYYLLTCNMCLSVWIGFLISLSGFGVLHPLLDPFIAYSAVFIINFLIETKN